MLKKIKTTLWLYLDDLLLIAGGACLSRAAALVHPGRWAGARRARSWSGTACWSPVRTRGGGVNDRKQSGRAVGQL